MLPITIYDKQRFPVEHHAVDLQLNLLNHGENCLAFSVNWDQDCWRSQDQINIIWAIDALAYDVFNKNTYNK